MGCLYSTEIPNVPELHYNITAKIQLKNLKRTFPFRHLVFEGASSNGTPLVGAYKVLWDVGIIKQVTKIAGVSSGTFMATIAALKLDPKDVIAEFIDQNFEEFKDDSFGIITDAIRVLNENGFYKGDVLERWIESVLYRYTSIRKITFAQLHVITGVDLEIVVGNLSKIKVEYMNSADYPDQCVSEAIRWSTSIPLVFRSRHNQDGDLMVDGGFGDNYPIDRFGPSNLTMGLKIMERNETRDAIIRHNNGPADNPVEYISALMMFQSTLMERSKVDANYWKRTVTINSPGRAITDFDVTAGEKKIEMEQGMKDMTTALWYWSHKGTFENGPCGSSPLQLPPPSPSETLYDTTRPPSPFLQAGRKNNTTDEEKDDLLIPPPPPLTRSAHADINDRPVAI